jgi:toxin YhaV
MQFERRYRNLVEKVEKLHASLSRKDYEHHPEVKLLAAAHRLITSLTPADPNARDFRLGDDLSKFRRVKKHGLPERYRLFYTFSSVDRVIILLYLNDADTLRKRGAGSDPYEIFKRMVRRGEVGSDFDANWKAWLSANRELAIKPGLVVRIKKTARSVPKGMRNRPGKAARRPKR